MNEMDVELVVRTVLEVLAQSTEDDEPCPDCGKTELLCDTIEELKSEIRDMRSALQSHILKERNTPVTHPHGWGEVDWGTGGPPRSPIHWIHQVICAANDNGANKTEKK